MTKAKKLATTLLNEVISQREGNLTHIVDQLKTFSAQQLLTLKCHIQDMEQTIDRAEITSAIEKILENHSNKETFALPSHGLMFTLLAMFAGKTKFIPRPILAKPHSQRTPKEREEVDKYIKSIFQKESFSDFSEGFEQKKENSIALICDNPRVEARAQIKDSVFQKDLGFREERLAVYIRRTYGPEGLRHFLGLILGLEENYRQGYFEWQVNEHLERLGYRRKTNGTFDPELKRTASEIIKVFTQLCITSKRKNGNSHSINGDFLFVVSGFQFEIFNKEIINETIKLTATDFWYKNTFDARDGEAPKYTKLLRKIVRENHRENPLTLYLAPLLSIFWRMQPEQKIKLRNLMEWCDLKTSGQYKLRDLRRLNASLDYMKAKGYLGRWTHSGEQKNLSENADPLELLLTLIPPDWLRSEMEMIQNKRETFAVEKKPSLTTQEFCSIFKASGLTADLFGKHLGVTGQYVGLLKSGKRKISKKIAAKTILFQQTQLS